MGDLAYLFDANGGGIDANVISIDEFKRFFKYFFIGGVFGTKSKQDFYTFSITTANDEIVQELIAKRVLVVNPSQGVTTYDVNPTFQRTIQKFVNENTLSKSLREIVKPWTSGSTPKV